MFPCDICLPMKNFMFLNDICCSDSPPVLPDIRRMSPVFRRRVHSPGKKRAASALRLLHFFPVYARFGVYVVVVEQQQSVWRATQQVRFGYAFCIRA